MSWFKPHSRFEDLFGIGILIKGIDGLTELVIGFVLLFVTPAQIHGLASLLTQKELAEDPDSSVANFILRISQSYSHGGSLFVVVYLWIHAAVKLIAVIGILRQKLWAYPFSLITLGLLLLYQIISIISKPSIGMVLLSLLDIVILWLIWKEYRRIKPLFKKKQEASE